MTINKNDPNYQITFTSKNMQLFTIWYVKIRKDNKNTKSHFFEFLKNQFKLE